MPLTYVGKALKTKTSQKTCQKMRFEAFGETKANKKQCVQAMDCFFFLSQKYMIVIAVNELFDNIQRISPGLKNLGNTGMYFILPTLKLSNHRHNVTCAQ